MSQKNLNLLLSLHKRGLSQEMCVMNAAELMARKDLVDFAETIVAFFNHICDEKIQGMMMEVAHTRGLEKSDDNLEKSS
jgi:hypothetical protein